MNIFSVYIVQVLFGPMQNYIGSLHTSQVAHQAGAYPSLSQHEATRNISIPT